jgi:hypothetical protein
MPAPRRRRDAHAYPRSRGCSQHVAAGAVDRLARVDEQVDERDPQPLGIGRHRRQLRIQSQRDLRARPEASAAPPTRGRAR